MTRKLTAVLLILAAVLANVAFTALGSIFNYPDVLDEPAGAVLASFRDHQGAVSAWFAVLALSAALLAPVAIGVGRLSPARAMRIAVPVGIAAAVVQVVGLLRWPILVPGYAVRRREREPRRRGRRTRRVHDRERHPRHGARGDRRLPPDRDVDAARRRRARPALHRALVPGARRGRGGARPRRRPLAVRPARDRHRELLRLRALERVADRVRDRDPAPRAAPHRGGTALEPGRGGGVTPTRR